jgi:hypothetical protein
MPGAKARRQQRAHGLVHPQPLPEALLRRHGPVDRHLMRVSGAFVVSFGSDRHGMKRTHASTMSKRQEFAPRIP